MPWYELKASYNIEHIDPSQSILAALAFIPKHYNTVILVVYLLGKGASAAGQQMVWMYTNELYPTNLRGQVHFDRNLNCNWTHN